MSGELPDADRRELEHLRTDRDDAHTAWKAAVLENERLREAARTVADELDRWAQDDRAGYDQAIGCIWSAIETLRAAMRPAGGPEA